MATFQLATRKSTDSRRRRNALWLWRFFSSPAAVSFQRNRRQDVSSIRKTRFVVRLADGRKKTQKNPEIAAPVYDNGFSTRFRRVADAILIVSSAVLESFQCVSAGTEARTSTSVKCGQCVKRENRSTNSRTRNSAAQQTWFIDGREGMKINRSRPFLRYYCRTSIKKSQWGGRGARVRIFF